MDGQTWKLCCMFFQVTAVGRFDQFASIKTDKGNQCCQTQVIYVIDLSVYLLGSNHNDLSYLLFSLLLGFFADFSCFDLICGSLRRFVLLQCV